MEYPEQKHNLNHSGKFEVKKDNMNECTCTKNGKIVQIFIVPRKFKEINLSPKRLTILKIPNIKH